MASCTLNIYVTTTSSESTAELYLLLAGSYTAHLLIRLNHAVGIARSFLNLWSERKKSGHFQQAHWHDDKWTKIVQAVVSLLVWMLVTKLNWYLRTTLDRQLTETGPDRDSLIWRKHFQGIWKIFKRAKFSKVPITTPLNNSYNFDAKQWVCTCHQFPSV